MTAQSAPTPDSRKATLETAIVNATCQGWTLVHRSDATYTAVVGATVQKPPVNHVLHLILTLLTGGLWVIVWIILMLSANKATSVRQTISVDASGNVTVG